MRAEELEELVRAHEQWLKDQRQGAPLKLRGVVLRGVCLAGRRLNRAELADVDLSEADLEESLFSGANLCGVSFRGAKLVGASFSLAELEDVDLREAELRAGEFMRSKLMRVKLCGARLEGADFNEAELEEVDFAGADMRRAELYVRVGMRLQFDGAQLEEAKLVKADLSDTSFVRANLRRANLRRLELFDGSFYEADLREADLTRAYLIGVDLRGADLTDARLLRTLFRRINVHSLHGTPAVVANCTIEAVDASAAGDGSDMRDPAWLLRQWGVHDPLHVVAVDVNRDIWFGTDPSQQFDAGFRVRLNGAVTVEFIPDIQRDASAWWDTVLDQDPLPDALAARRLSVLLAAYVVTPNAARAGQQELFADGAPAAQATPDAQLAHLFYVSPAAFARYEAELAALADATGETQAAHSLGTLRDRAFIALLRERVIPAFTPTDRQALGVEACRFSERRCTQG
jgi:uncharacterized protein YjbI with pentapeptide repeats